MQQYFPFSKFHHMRQDWKVSEYKLSLLLSLLILIYNKLVFYNFSRRELSDWNKVLLCINLIKKFSLKFHWNIFIKPNYTYLLVINHLIHKLIFNYKKITIQVSQIYWRIQDQRYELLYQLVQMFQDPSLKPKKWVFYLHKVLLSQ